MKRTTQARSPSAAPDTDAGVLNLPANENAEPLPPKDPMAIMAHIMVDRLLDLDSELAPSVRRPGSASVIEVPDTDWLDAIADAWDQIMWRDEHLALDGDDIRRHYRVSEIASGSKSVSCEFRRGGTGKHTKAQGNEGVAWALSQGIPVCGFSSAPEVDLPSDLLRVAERTVTVPNPNPSMVARLAKALCGGDVTQDLPEELCRQLTGRELWLAVRPSQTADDYIGRLRQIVDNKPKSDAGLTLDDLGGMHEAVEWGHSLAQDMVDYREGRITWHEIDPGVLLHGLPGTGKTTFARALAGSCQIPLITGSLAEWQARGHLGDLLKAMRATFRAARTAAPAILFLDEIDSFGTRDSKGDSDNRNYQIQVINGLLEELDGIGARDGVVVVGACNNPDRLDPALIRSGRLDRRIEIPLPDISDLEKILRFHLSGELANEDLYLAASNAHGSTGADIKRLVRGARRRARAERRRLELDDLHAEIGLPEAVVVPPQHLWRSAVHEAGHAVIACLERPGRLVRVTVRRNSFSAGATMTANDCERAAMTACEIDSMLKVLLAGRAAEQVILGEVSTGAGGTAQSDLAKATLLATTAAANFGFSPTIGLNWLGDVNPDTFTHILVLNPALAKDVSATLGRTYENVVARIMERGAVVRRVAELLVESETVEGPDIEALVASEKVNRVRDDTERGREKRRGRRAVLT